MPLNRTEARDPIRVQLLNEMLLASPRMFVLHVEAFRSHAKLIEFTAKSPLPTVVVSPLPMDELLQPDKGVTFTAIWKTPPRDLVPLLT